MVRTKEGGSVLGFVVIGVVLVGLLVGGAYFLSRQPSELAGGGNEEMQDPAPAPGEEENGEGSDGDSGSNNEQENGEEAPTDNSGENSQANEQQNQSESSNEDEAPLLGAGGNSNDSLPETGPGDTLFVAVALALLTGVGVSL